MLSVTGLTLREDLVQSARPHDRLAAQLEHPANGTLGFEADRFGDGYLRLEVIQAVAQLFERVELHVATVGAGAEIGWPGNKELAGHFFPEPMEHSALGDDDERARRALPAVAHHFFG